MDSAKNPWTYDFVIVLFYGGVAGDLKHHDAHMILLQWVCGFLAAETLATNAEMCLLWS